MRLFGAVRALVARRWRDERGIALIMALGIMTVLGISAASVAYYTSAQSRTAERNENSQDAYSLAEAGMNAALAVLNQSINARTATALPSCSGTLVSMTLEGGTAKYCGDLNTTTYVWTIGAEGIAPNPTGGSAITKWLHRTVSVVGISDGASVSAWSRFYQDSPTQCLNLDTITIPGSVAAKHCLTMKNGAQITGASTEVDVGGNVTITGSGSTSSAKSAGTGAGWTSSGNIVSSNDVYATSSVATSSSTANLDATNFGFSIPTNSTILGVTAKIERKEATASPQITLDSATSAAALTGVMYDTASSASSASASTTLAWSHTVANQANRVLVVGVTAEYGTSNACQASTVTYGAQSLTKITQNVAGTSTYACASLWYLVAPNVGTNTITVTYQNSITNRTAGAVGLYNVKQAAPDASNSSFSNSGATSTSVTTLAANSTVVDVFGSGQGVGDLGPSSGQTSRWTQDSGGTESSGMSTKPVGVAGSTTLGWTQSGINRSAQVVAAFQPVVTSATTVSWSHTVANQSNRVLVVGVTAEYTSNSCQASTVTYGGQSLTKIAQTVTTNSSYECASLWYLLAPTVGTNTITVTYQTSMADMSAGAVSLYNVKQAAPDASNSSFSNSSATSTSVTTLSAQSWVVDVFASGIALGNLAPSSGQTSRWTQDSNGNQSSGMSTKPVATAGSTTLGWTQTGNNRSAQVVAAFAPLASGELQDNNVFLLKAGSPVGTDHAGGVDWTTSDTTPTYGNSTDLWGTTLTPADVNASTFGVRLKVKNNSTTTSNTASVDYISVTVYYEPIPTASIGTSSQSVAAARVDGTCTRGSQQAHTPCTSNDNVFATTSTTGAQNLDKPSVDIDYWWANAAPGPKHPCTTSTGSPPVFDNNASTTTGPDLSVHDSGEIAPNNADYTCVAKDSNGNTIGELDWNHTTHVLTITGTIFRDGDFRFDEDGEVVHYQGRGIIYTPGHIEFDAQVCAGGSGTTSCFGYPYPSSSSSSWDPTHNLMILLTTNTSTGLNNPASEYDQGGTQCNTDPSAGCPNGYLPAGFQGIVYANGDCLIHQMFQISGPVMCNNINIINGQSGSGDNGYASWPSFYTWPPLGSLVNGQVYVSTGSADTFQLTLGPTDG